MKTDIFLQKTSNLFTENRLLKFVILVLALAVIVNTFLVNKSIRYQRVVLIPPKLTGTIEFVQGKPSDQYIRDMAGRIVSLATTYSPATARRQFDELLGMYAPEAYPQASKAWYALASRVEESHVSNVFYMKNLILDSSNNRLEISGERKQFSDDKLLDTNRKTYVARYQVKDGRFQLLSFMERMQDLTAQGKNNG